MHQLIGDVWEWTSSGWHPYPGFTVFPYPEYSQVFFGGDYRVLRGGSFGTDASAIREHVPQLGPPDPPADLLRLPLRPGRGPGRRGGCLSRCAVTWPTSARPTTLAALLLDPPHGLLHQSYAPADMRGDGTVNADGFGAGWYPAEASGADSAADRRPPARYRSDRPIWADTGVRRARGRHHGRGPCSPRCARPPPACRSPRRRRAPFAEGPLAVQPQRADPRLAGRRGRARGGSCPSRTCSPSTPPRDSALLWALVRHRLRAGDDPAAVLADVVRAVDAAAPGSRLNLLLTDGTAIWATTWTHALSVRVEAGAVTVASEPTDGGAGWMAVPDRHLVVATPQRCDVHPLDAAARARSKIQVARAARA